MFRQGNWPVGYAIDTPIRYIVSKDEAVQLDVLTTG